MPSCDAEKSTVVCDYSPTEFRDVTLEIHQVLGLLPSMDIIKVNVLVSPLEVVNDSFICKLFLENKDILEKVQNPLLNIKMIKLGNHSLLVFEISLVLINKSISFIDYATDIIEYCGICASSGLFKACKLIL